MAFPWDSGVWGHITRLLLVLATFITYLTSMHWTPGMEAATLKTEHSLSLGVCRLPSSAVERSLASNVQLKAWSMSWLWWPRILVPQASSSLRLLPKHSKYLCPLFSKYPSFDNKWPGPLSNNWYRAMEFQRRERQQKLLRVPDTWVEF